MQSVFDKRFGKCSKPQEACKYGDACTKGYKCTYSHPPKKEGPAHKNHQRQKTCKFGENCLSSECTFAHLSKVAATKLEPASKKFAFNPHVAVFVPQCKCGAFLYGGFSSLCYQCIEQDAEEDAEEEEEYDEDEDEAAQDEIERALDELALEESKPETVASEKAERPAFVVTLKKRS